MAWAPLLADLRHLTRGDLVAGVTIAAYAVPQVMAYSALAGVPPESGLWVLVFVLPLYVLVGSSRYLSIGPESTTALLTATTLAPLALGSQERYLALAAALALMLGALAIVAWMLRLGFMGDLLSKPVLVGYMAGVAVMMIVSQLTKTTGVAVDGDSLIVQAASFVENIGQVHVPTAVLGAVVVVLLLILTPRFPRFPMPLAVVLAATIVTASLGLQALGIKTVGSVDSSLPAFGVGTISPDDIRLLVLPALGLLVVAYSDNLLTARMFGARHRQPVDANRELLAVGVGNIASGLVHGFPISSSASRAAIGDASGARSQWSGIVVSVVIAAILLGFGGALASFPMAALGGLVIYAATRLIDLAEFRRLWRFRRREFALALTTLVAVLAVGILYGILAAVVISILEMLARVARPHAAVLGQPDTVAGWHDITDYPEAHQVPGLLVFRYDSPLFFANAEDFLHDVQDAIAAASPAPRWLLLNMEAIVQVDITGLDALAQLVRDCEAQGIEVALARVKHEVLDLLKRHGVGDQIGSDRIYPTLPTAVQAYVDWRQSED